jgi:Protein of unknown function (DUF1592)/Protein of unknown function (DUF1588)/Protein of unknown function (DUF1585)/Protein of unknown function (DUF1595)/Protein of unknown function (DUF1587)
MKQFPGVVVASILLIGCTGVVGDSAGRRARSGGQSGGTGSGGTDVLPPPSQSCDQPNDMVFRNDAMVRLNKTQYENSLVSIFGPGVKVAAMPEEKAVHEYFNNAREQGVSDTLVRAYELTAADLAKRVVSEKEKFAPCASGVSEAICGNDFVNAFGGLAFRRPLENSERERFELFFADALRDHGYDNAVAMTAEVFLSSPQFLYRMDVGASVDGRDGVRKLTDFEVANKLSYLLTDSSPDAELIRAASDGKLQDELSVLAQARRLLNTPAGRKTVASFFDQWLFTASMNHIDKDTNVFPAYRPEDNLGYRESYQKFIASAAIDDGTLESLLTSKTTFANEKLAKIMGITTVSGADLKQVVLTGNVSAQRGGLLTQPAWLAAMAHDNIDSPVLRGLFVFERLFCQAPPPPPEDVVADIQFEATGRKQTARMMIEEQHESSATCRSCHKPFDTIGFAFGNFDAVGAWRDKDAGFDVNATVTLPLLDDREITGANALAELLSQSDDVKACVAIQWFRYGFGRSEGDSDACALQNLVTQFNRSGGNMNELWLAVVGSDSFRFRAPLLQ